MSAIIGHGQFLAYRPQSLVGRLIVWQTRYTQEPNRTCHIAVRLPYSGMVIEAYEEKTVDKQTGKIYPAGVRIRPLWLLGNDFVTYDVPEMTINEWSNAANWAMGERGCGYDYRSIARFITRRNPANADPNTGGDLERWFCDEFAFYMLEVVGYRLLERVKAAYISPGQFCTSPLLRVGTV